MRKILILLCVLLASPAAAQIQKVQGVAGGYPVRVDVVSGGGGGGDATAANQVTEIARLTSILTALGGGLPASLVGGALSVTASALPLPTGAATSALQTTGNTSLASIDSTLTLVNAALAKLTIAQGAALGSNTVAMSGCSVAAASPTHANGTIQPCSLDTTGRLRTLVSGSLTPTDATANPTTLVGTQAFLMGWNPNTSQWDRIFAEGIQSDNDNGPASGLLSAENYPMIFDGATWDRWRASSATSGSARILPHDGTNGAGITAPSTAAATADPGLVVALSPNSPTPKFADGTCSGTLTNGAPTLTCSSLQGISLAGFHLAYGTTGSISVACSYDGTNYSSALPFVSVAAPQTVVSSVSATGDYYAATPGCNAVRFTLTAGSGSHTISARLSGATPPPAIGVAQGTAAAQSGAWPVLLSNGTTNASLATATAGPAATALVVTPNQQQTFVVSAQGIAPGNGKSMISIANGAGSGKTIRIQAIAIYPTTDSAVTGVNVQYDAFKFTTHASGTSLTAIALDSQNSLSGSVTAQTNATITGAGTIPLDSWFQNGDEITSAGLTPSAQASIDGQRRRVYGVNELQPIVVRAGEGFFIKCQTNTTVGTFTVFVWFTQE